MKYFHPLIRSLSPGLALALASTLAEPGLAWGEERAGLRGNDIAPESVTAALAKIGGMSPAQCRSEADKLPADWEGLSDLGKAVVELGQAAALECAGNSERAKAAYRSVVRHAPNTALALSAQVRFRLLENPENAEKYWGSMALEPAHEGWFMAGGAWALTTSDRAAREELMKLRSGYASVRVLNFLRSQSPWPPEYAYLFIFLVLGLGAKLLEFPLQIRIAKVGAQVRRLRPELEVLRRDFGSDPLEHLRKQQELYERRGLNTTPGCLLGVVDLIFVIWALITLSDYAPQLALDGGRFWGAADITQPSGSVLVLWIVWGIAQGIALAYIQGGSAAQNILGAIFASAIFAGIAWYWDWPAYVMIFWWLLSSIGLAINFFMVQAFAASLPRSST